MVSLSENLQQLYEEDYLVWLEKNTLLLKNRQFQELDLDNLVEELEDLGNERKHAVESYLTRTIQHLLLYQYWINQRNINLNHWIDEISNFRYELNLRLTANLSNYLANNLSKCYASACKLNRKKPNFNVSLPTNCPYTLEQILDIDWFPNVEE
jgi:hypothetical protein